MKTSLSYSAAKLHRLNRLEPDWSPNELLTVIFSKLIKSETKIQAFFQKAAQGFFYYRSSFRETFRQVRDVDMISELPNPPY